MRVINSFPPNIFTIRQYLTPPPDAVFAYGDTIYNPTGKDIPDDVIVHEQVHQGQMQGWIPDSWWLMYLMDKSFRQEAETHGYAVQYRWVKDRVNSRTAKLCLIDLAQNLASLYSLSITVAQAATLIRKYALPQEN